MHMLQLLTIQSCHKSMHMLQLFSYARLYPSHIYKHSPNTNVQHEESDNRPERLRSLIKQRSGYRKSLSGDFIRNRQKIEQNCRLFLDIFISAILNDLFMTFTSRLKVDAKCVYQQWNWITVANYFGTPPADWVHGCLYFEPGAWIWT